MAFMVLLFLAKIAGHYSWAAILATYLAGIPAVAALPLGYCCRGGERQLPAGFTTERIFLIAEKDVMSVSHAKPWNAGNAIVDTALPQPTPPNCDPSAPLWLPISPPPLPVAGQAAGRAVFLLLCSGPEYRDDRDSAASTPS